MLVKLKDPRGIFYDPQTGFSIVADEVKPLPPLLGDLTRRWLNAGGIIKVSQSPSVEELTVTEANEIGDPVSRSLHDYITEFGRFELMRLAKERGIEVRRSDTALDLAKKLAMADFGK